MIKTEILFRRTPLPVLVDALERACGGRTAAFYRATLQSAGEGLTLSTAAARHRGRLRRDGLSREDADVVLEVCAVLGRYDGATQAEAINRAVARLEDAAVQAREDAEAKGKLYRALGVTAGIVLALIAI